LPRISGSHSETTATSTNDKGIRHKRERSFALIFSARCDNALKPNANGVNTAPVSAATVSVVASNGSCGTGYVGAFEITRFAVTVAVHTVTAPTYSDHKLKPAAIASTRYTRPPIGT